MALVTFLRGVNVGGHKALRPSMLANQLRQYGMLNIGAAGTFVVRQPVSQTQLRSELLKKLPFHTEVMMCTGQQLLAAARDNPFDGDVVRANVVRFVGVLAKRPRISPSIPLRIPSNGKWLVQILSRHERFLFGFYRREMRTIGCLGSIDKMFGVPAAIRNWNTIHQVLKILEQAY